MKVATEKHHVGLDIPPSLFNRISDFQSRTGFSKSDVVRTALLKMFGLIDLKDEAYISQTPLAKPVDLIGIHEAE